MVSLGITSWTLSPKVHERSTAGPAWSEKVPPLGPGGIITTPQQYLNVISRLVGIFLYQENPIFREWVVIIRGK